MARNRPTRANPTAEAESTAVRSDAAGGVVRYLEGRGIGFPTRAARVPIVPAAILFDLGVGDARRQLPRARQLRGAARQHDPGWQQPVVARSPNFGLDQFHNLHGARFNVVGSAFRARRMQELGLCMKHFIKMILRNIHGAGPGWGWDCRSIP